MKSESSNNVRLTFPKFRQLIFRHTVCTTLRISSPVCPPCAVRIQIKKIDKLSDGQEDAVLRVERLTYRGKEFYTST